jgi:hypothetical protein
MLQMVDLGCPMLHFRSYAHYAGFLTDFAGKAAQKQEEHDHSKDFFP